jgi:hypothetical protein
MNMKIVVSALLFALSLCLSSCASKQTAFIADPNGKKETALPWNEQQKWEREGEAASLNQQSR